MHMLRHMFFFLLSAELLWDHSKPLLWSQTRYQGKICHQVRKLNSAPLLSNEWVMMLYKSPRLTTTWPCLTPLIFGLQDCETGIKDFFNGKLYIIGYVGIGIAGVMVSQDLSWKIAVENMHKSTLFCEWEWFY